MCLSRTKCILCRSYQNAVLRFRAFEPFINASMLLVAIVALYLSWKAYSDSEISSNQNLELAKGILATANNSLELQRRMIQPNILISFSKIYNVGQYIDIQRNGSTIQLVLRVSVENSGMVAAKKVVLKYKVIKIDGAPYDATKAQWITTIVPPMEPRAGYNVDLKTVGRESVSNTEYDELSKKNAQGLIRIYLKMEISTVPESINDAIYFALNSNEINFFDKKTFQQ